MTDWFPPILGLLFPQYGYFFDMQQYVKYMFNIEQYMCDTYETRNIVRAQIEKNDMHWTALNLVNMLQYVIDIW